MSYSFTDGIRHFAENAKTNQRAVFEATNAELRDSIKFGSARTGAPPMPVANPSSYTNNRRKRLPPGTLRDSVKLVYTDVDHATIYTTQWYAPLVEDDAQGHTFTSGAPHGWKITVAAFTKVVEANAKRIAGGGK